MQRQVNANPFPVIEPQQNVGVSDVQVTDESEEDLLINNLIYSMPKSLSLATQRTYVRMFPQERSMEVNKNNTMVTIFNTGNNYINAANSFLKFKLSNTYTVAGAHQTTFGSGSAINIFNNFTARSKSGTELARSLEANQWARNNILYTHSKAWMDTIGSSFACNQVDDAGAPTAASLLRLTNVLDSYYTIPLVELDPFFSTHKNLLLPPQLASGLTLELGFENPSRACVVNADAINVMTISEIEWVLDAVNLSDDTQRVLNLESSQTGLEVSYRRVFKAANNAPAGSTSFTLQMMRAVAQAESCFVHITNPANDMSPLVDSFASVPYTINSSQFRLGSLYMPQQPTKDYIVTANALSGQENYLMALQSFDKLRHPFQEASVTLAQYELNKGILGVSFEKNQDLSVSGLSINNSRVLELLLNFGVAVAPVGGYTVSMFLTYCSVSKCFIDNTAVAI